MLQSADACRYVRLAERLVGRDFATGTMEHVLGWFTSSCGVVFVLEFSRHSVVFAIFCNVASIFAADGTVWGSLASASSSAFSPTVHSAASAATAIRMVETPVLLVRRWYGQYRNCQRLSRLLLEIIDRVEGPDILLHWCLGRTWGFVCLYP